MLPGFFSNCTPADDKNNTKATAPVTVVLNIWKRKYLAEQLQALAGQTTVPESIWVVHYENHVAADKHLKGYPNVTRLHCTKNLKYFGHFSLANHIDTPYTWMLDDDIIPSSTWVETCLRTCETLRQVEIAIVNNNSAQTSKRKEILELDKSIAEQKVIFVQALHTLRSRVDDWKKKYLLLSPTDGQVYFSSFLQEHQSVKPGQEVFFVGAENEQEFGEIRIPQYNFGKTRVGQRVRVRFNAYPSQEFGVVEGKIQSISQVPRRDSTFLAKVVLPKGLETNYRKKLTYKSGMTATAEIVTEDTRLEEKVFYSLRKALQR